MTPVSDNQRLPVTDRMTFRGLLMWTHLILGLTVAVILAIVAITGAYITFQVPLQRWLNPIPVIADFTGFADAQAIVSAVESRFAPNHVATIDVRRRQATVVRLRDRTTVFVNPRDATIIGARPARFASLENLTLVMRRLHTNLIFGPKGRLLVTVATAEALLLALTGLWLWWRKKHWQFRAWRGSAFRVSWDLHNATGIWFLIPVLSMVITGLLIAMPSAVHRVAGARPAPFLSAPSSKIEDSRDSAPSALSRILAVADSAVPAEPVLRLVIPAGPAGAFAVGKASATVYVDQFSGAAIEV